MLSDAETVSPDEVRRMIAEGVRLVDVRDRARFAEERIEGAVNVPLGELLAGADLPTGPVIFYCESGREVWRCAERLRERVGELNFYAIERGLDEWKAAGMAVVRG
jgi:rhodanese-related sulfurtransferase